MPSKRELLNQCRDDRTVVQSEISALEKLIADAKAEKEILDKEIASLRAQLDACEDSPDPEVDPDPPPDPDPPMAGIRQSPVASLNGALIFEDGYEDNNFRKWVLDAPLNDPNFSGQGDGGAIMGAAGIRACPAELGGGHWWKAEVDPALAGTYYPAGRPQKSQCEHWRRMLVPEWCSSQWMYIPTSWPEIYTLIWQSKSTQHNNPFSNYAPFSLNLRRGVHTRKFVVNTHVGGGFRTVALGPDDARAPIGKWFNISCRVQIGRYPAPGRTRIWFDGRKIFDLPDSNSDGDYGYIGIGNYTPDWPVKAHIFFDDVRVTLPA